MTKFHRAPLLFLAAIATAAAKLTPDWRVVSAAKGVTTRARIDATSQLCAVHGEAVVEASVAELMSVFGDLDQHGHWDATLVDAREWTGADGGTYVYQRFKQPWPVRDRELVLRRREWRRNQTVSVHFESVDEGTPVAPGAVRTLAHGVWWNFTAVSETETLISHYSCVDPGGAIPAWARDLAVQRWCQSQILALVDTARRLGPPARARLCELGRAARRPNSACGPRATTPRHPGQRAVPIERLVIPILFLPKFEPPHRARAGLGLTGGRARHDRAPDRTHFRK